MKTKFITKLIIILCDITIISIIIYWLYLIHWTLVVATIVFVISVIVNKIKKNHEDD